MATAALLLAAVSVTSSGATLSHHHRPAQKPSLRARRVTETFKASSALRPMAQQLLETRSATAYAGVERYARSHARQDAGALAWLALGYVHLLDHQCPAALPAFKKAQPHAGVLADYVDYFIADCDTANGDPEATLQALAGFDEHYPQSLLGASAAVLAADAWSASGNPQRALTLLQPHRQPYQPAVELAVARAQLAAGNLAGAAGVLRHLYYSDPLAPEALTAESELAQLATAAPLAPVITAEREQRAAILVQGHRAADAVPEYQALVAAAEQPALQLDLAQALWLSGRSQQAEELLRGMADPGGELGARRLYYLLELARPEAEKVAGIITQLRAAAPQSPWLEAALAATGNMYLLREDDANAQHFFAELEARFPTGHFAAYAAWKSAWLQFRLGNVEGAKAAFEQQVERYPQSPEVPAALYWRGRVAEQENDLAAARAYYSAASFQIGSYYSGLAAGRRQARGMTGPPLMDPLFARVDRAATSPRFDAVAPVDDLHAQKSLLLENAGLADLAVRELQAVAREGDESWSAVQIARVYTEAGHWDRALDALKHAAPTYFALPFSDLPRAVWEGLFPRPYWNDLKRAATRNQLDPFLVAALIRQESGFNPGAVSVKQAMGLMQLLPETGRRLAHQEKLRRFNRNELFDPRVNLRLGTRYLRGLLDQYDSQVELALAAYDAGPDRVKEWSNRHYRDLPEFVESIPFSETRNYVEAILRNREVYKRLYGSAR